MMDCTMTASLVKAPHEHTKWLMRKLMASFLQDQLMLQWCSSRSCMSTYEVQVDRHMQLMSTSYTQHRLYGWLVGH